MPPTASFKSKRVEQFLLERGSEFKSQIRGMKCGDISLRLNFLLYDGPSPTVTVNSFTQVS